MRVLLSIKPVYAQKIFSGEKKFEFRRSIFKNKDITKIVVYASSPISKVIGEFEIEEIVHENIDALWKKTKNHAGISKDYFEAYFTDRDLGYAIKVKNPRKYHKPKCIREHYNIVPPQSFSYIS